MAPPASRIPSASVAWAALSALPAAADELLRDRDPVSLVDGPIVHDQQVSDSASAAALSPHAPTRRRSWALLLDARGGHGRRHRVVDDRGGGRHDAAHDLPDVRDRASSRPPPRRCSPARALRAPAMMNANAADEERHADHEQPINSTHVPTGSPRSLQAGSKGPALIRASRSTAGQE